MAVRPAGRARSASSSTARSISTRLIACVTPHSMDWGLPTCPQIRLKPTPNQGGSKPYSRRGRRRCLAITSITRTGTTLRLHSNYSSRRCDIALRSSNGGYLAARSPQRRLTGDIATSRLFFKPARDFHPRRLVYCARKDPCWTGQKIRRRAATPSMPRRCSP